MAVTSYYKKLTSAQQMSAFLLFSLTPLASWYSIEAFTQVDPDSETALQDYVWYCARSLLFNAVLLLADYLLLPCTTNNLKLMKKKGFSSFYIWRCFFTNFFTFQAPVVLSVYYSRQMAGQNPASFEAFRPITTSVQSLWEAPMTFPEVFRQQILNTMDLDMVRSVVKTSAVAAGVLLSSDVCFWFGHYLLHEVKSLKSLHGLHHGCMDVSATSNMMFDPLDLAIEFSAPIAWIFCFCTLYLQDSWILTLTLYFVQCHYAATHMAWAQLQHARHHSNSADASYFIYVDWAVRLGITPRKKYVD